MMMILKKIIGVLRKKMVRDIALLCFGYAFVGYMIGFMHGVTQAQSAEADVCECCVTIPDRSQGGKG